MLGLAGVPSLVQFISFICMPESPRWLITHGQYEKAHSVLRKIHGSSLSIDDEFESIKQNCLDTLREQQEKGTLSQLGNTTYTRDN